MERRLTFSALLCSLLLCALGAYASRPIVYNGDSIPRNEDFIRKQCGTLITKNTIKEVSGIACSRVTPGYIWMQSDDYRNVIATDEGGSQRYMKIQFDEKIRWDWEDLCGGVYEGKNYLFIGAFGDNDHTDGEYSIIAFEEPEIVPSTATTTLHAINIKYAYPDGKKHNAEALMYDNKEQMLYVITKVYYDVCQVFCLPMRLDYGDQEQTLTYVCDLGVKSDLGEGTNPSKGFHLVTGADISPDGKYILIKNHNNITGCATYSWVLLWVREGEESVRETLKRQPEYIGCYSYEWQGEAICWLDSTVFYTTSDEDSGDPPIFKYIRKDAEGIATVQADKSKKTLVLIDNVMYIRNKDELYTLDGKKMNSH